MATPDHCENMHRGIWRTLGFVFLALTVFSGVFGGVVWTSWGVAQQAGDKAASIASDLRVETALDNSYRTGIKEDIGIIHGLIKGIAAKQDAANEQLSKLVYEAEREKRQATGEKR